MVGRVHSIETLGSVDGPGIRCVVFLQGCPMRCQYCHNPDTWQAGGGKEMTVEQVVAAVLRCRPYFGPRGGVTLGGGEPLMQADFAGAILARCRELHIHTAVDTNGYYLTDAARKALEFTDLVLLDIKHTDPRRHKELTGTDLSLTLEFLRYLADRRIATWIRQVIVPGWNDTPEDMAALAGLVRGIACIERVELLPYRKLGLWKYKQLNIACPLADTPEPDEATMARLRQELARHL